MVKKIVPRIMLGLVTMSAVLASAQSLAGGDEPRKGDNKRESVNFQASFAGCTNGQTVYIVPEGKELVIQTVSASVRSTIAPTVGPEFQLITNFGPDLSSQHYYFPLKRVASTTWGTIEDVTIYAFAGTQVGGDTFVEGGANCLTSVAISGYLVDAKRDGDGGKPY